MENKFKAVASIITATALGFLIGSFALTMPSPVILEVAKNDFGATIKGQTGPHMVVLAFDDHNNYITAVSSDGEGEFVFQGLSATTGTREMVMRVVDGRWRSSPPKKVNLVVEVALK